jgi:hypothetical protein
MSDDNDDYVIEVADAGASATVPSEAGQIKKGGYVDLAIFHQLVLLPTQSVSAVDSGISYEQSRTVPNPEWKSEC